MEINITNEYSKLEKVVVCKADYYDENKVAINNETIKYYKENGGVPTKEDILREQKYFWEVLQSRGIELLVADQVDGVKGQMFTRDLAFVIGDTFFISNMKKENRKKAIDGWDKIISSLDQKKIVQVPSDIYLEGGDVLVDKNKIYVGISERTNLDGVNFLKSVLDDQYEIIPLYLKPTFLHLDVVFTIVDEGLAIVYKDGLDDASYALLKDFEKIEITKEEQFSLATNVFVIDKKCVIVNESHERLQKVLQEYGFLVLPVMLAETAKDGGAFRCTTCPLLRIDKVSHKI